MRPSSEFALDTIRVSILHHPDTGASIDLASIAPDVPEPANDPRGQGPTAAGGIIPRTSLSERTDKDFVAHHPQVELHHAGRVGIVGVDDEACGQEVLAGLVAEPADHGHPAIFPLVGDVDLATEVVVEVDFVPGLRQAGQAFLGRPDPGGPRVLGQEGRGTGGVVVQEQDPTGTGC
jgi:hypothetical protein